MNLANTKLAIKRSFTWAQPNGRSKDAVFLTFDGRHPEFTPALLELLKKHNAQATFFVGGARIQRAPHLLTRILGEGHALGNALNHSAVTALRSKAKSKP